MPTAKPKFRSLRRLLDYNPRVAAKKGTRRFWTTTEVKALEQYYPSGVSHVASAVFQAGPRARSTRRPVTSACWHP